MARKQQELKSVISVYGKADGSLDTEITLFNSCCFLAIFPRPDRRAQTQGIWPAMRQAHFYR